MSARSSLFGACDGEKGDAVRRPVVSYFATGFLRKLMDKIRKKIAAMMTTFDPIIPERQPMLVSCNSINFAIVPRSQVVLGNASVRATSLPQPRGEAQLRRQVRSQVQLGNEGTRTRRDQDLSTRKGEVAGAALGVLPHAQAWQLVEHRRKRVEFDDPAMHHGASLCHGRGTSLGNPRLAQREQYPTTRRRLAI
jgi:hypothetical protein